MNSISRLAIKPTVWSMSLILPKCVEFRKKRKLYA
ncbi:Uncharacterised protein [Vibrio cholerae]|nr:Uncharacterised protein [Vibrio cholerae]CSI83181.1 Uncharacterised protein [Vibrio cholerae]